MPTNELVIGSYFIHTDQVNVLNQMAGRMGNRQNHPPTEVLALLERYASLIGTDVSGQPIGPSFKGQEVQEED